jgi:D-alanyl-D-alanine carboxypeptidase
MSNRFKKNSARLLSLVMVVQLFFTPLPVYANETDTNSSKESETTSVDDFIWPEGPDVFADGAIVMEASTGLILYEKDIYSAYYPASITKIMTTLLAIENCNLNETMTMSHEAEWDVDFNSSRIGLVEGESLSLKDALYAVMLESANEAAYGVAEHVSKGTMADFAAMMNARAKELGAKNTNFVNPNGLHDPNHYTCAYDMALISRAAIQLPDFRTITGSRTHTIPPTNKNVARPLANHHRFIRQTLTYDGAIGGKTGGTDEAKTTLVTYAQRNGLTLIAVVLHVDTALHAYEDTAKMLDFAFDNYALYNIEDTQPEDVTSFPSLFDNMKEVKPMDISKLSVSTNSNVVLPLKADYKDAVKTIEYQPVEEFVHGNNVVGKISYTYAGKYVGSTDILYYNDEYPLTKAAFDEQWPDYLIPPDMLFSDETNPANGTSSVPVNGTTTVEKPTTVTKETSKIKPILIGVSVTVIILVVGYYILFVEVPHRKRRTAYRKNHKKRMDSIRSSKNDDFLY